MASTKKKGATFEPNDKRTVRLEATGEEGQEAFRQRLTDEEKEALARMKELDSELCARWNDAFLMRFVWARKMDVERAIELLRNHMDWRREFEIDEGLDFESIRRNFQDGATLWTPGNYSKQGYSVSYIMAKHFNPALLGEMGMKGIMHGSYYALDLLLDHDMDVARKGAIIVEDFNGASFKDILALAKGDGKLDMKKMMESIQNHLPQRMGAILIVDAPWYIRLLMTLTRPMLKPKLRKKIHSISRDELNKWFTPEQLPTIYGGQFELNNDWQEAVFTHRTTLSEGQFIDPSPKSAEMFAAMTGVQPHEELPAKPKKPKKEKKDKKKKDKKPSEEDSSSSSSDSE